MNSTGFVAPCAGAWIEIEEESLSDLDKESLPVRERGLKFYDRMFCIRSNRSLPVRERGLKYNGTSGRQDAPASLPVRERGLK